MSNPEGEQSRKILIWAVGSLVLTAVIAPGLIWFGEEPETNARSVVVASADPADLDADRFGALPEYAEASSVRSTANESPRSLLEERGAARRAASSASAEGSFDCIIEPSERVMVGSAETGVLQEIRFDRSDLVEKDDIVAMLESDVEKMAVGVAKFRAETDSGVRSAETSLDLGRKRQARADELFEGKAMSLDLREEVDTEARLAELKVTEAEESKRLAALQLGKARADLRRRTIRSPISGVVVERLKSPGEVVKEEAILALAQIDPLRVEVILPAAMFGELAPGMRAQVMPEPPADGVYIAKVGLVDRVIDAASGTFGVRLELPNPDYSIPSGLHCQVSFMAGESGENAP